MKSTIINTLLILITLVIPCKSWAQPERVLLSLGLNVGVNYPLNQFAKVSADNIYGGKIKRGGFVQIFGAYHLSKHYRITGGLFATTLTSPEIDRKLDALVSNYTSLGSGDFASAALIFGPQKNIYVNGRDEFTIFVRPSLGIQLNRSIYERKVYVRNSGPGLINLEEDWFISPVFAFASGIEFTLAKHFQLIIAGQYSFSNYGSENILATDQGNQNQYQLIPDVNIGWVHQASASIGLGLNLFRRKK
jgi:hypothetical protein